MWIKSIVLVWCFAIACLAVDKPANEAEGRGKRNLQYSIAHHYGGSLMPAYRLERRISSGGSSQIPLYHNNFFPGPPRSHSPYFNKDGQSDDLLSDNNHLNEHVYGAPHKQIIERPVYIKEPEPIIEIIIKESNVSLPALPTPPPPPKKKEQVQVFYVKYKKNPNGSGKDSVIYEKPIPAISPNIPEEHEEPEIEHHHHHEEVTALPPPSTTLRTIIHPESETYHSPSGVKVTFGKEGFDYDKRSPKPADLKAVQPAEHQRTVQFPQGRQLQAFPPSFQRSSRPPPGFNNFPPQQQQSFRPEVPQRQPQPYRPFSTQPQFRPGPPSFQRPNSPPPQPQPQQYSTLPKYLTESKPNPPQFPPNRPAPPQYHQQQLPSSSRQPVPYQPFDTLRQAPPSHQHPIQFRPQTHFPVSQQAPLNEKPAAFSQFSQSQYFTQPSDPGRQQAFKQQLPKQSSAHFSQQPHFSQPPAFNQGQFNNNHQFSHQPPPQQQIPAQFSHQQENPLQHTQNVIPPGGELIHSLPKFEQHISVLEPQKTQQPQALPLQHPRPQFTQQIQPQVHNNGQPTPQIPSFAETQKLLQNNAELTEKLQQQLKEANALQESIRNSQQQQQQQSFFSSQPKQEQPRFLPTTTHYQTTTPRSYSTSTTQQTPSTTTTEKVTTTTKDPKVLEAQLPDEVPEDLRAQLLSSGILNNADISILDYDKVGDIPLSALPPDQLANFYNAGGAQQIAGAGSAPIPTYVRSSQVDRIADEDGSASEVSEVRAKPEVQMKVVHYDPESERGQRVQDAYVKDDARQVDPVVLNDDKYNRYLPLKVSGAQFPIPDVPELRGKQINSVVVLAPVTYDFSAERKTRDTKKESADDIDLIEGDALKDLLKSPTQENFRRFLENENQTRSDKQAVILLVTAGNKKEKEIFMYDVATQTVNKLDGELSSAFVEAAEANATDKKNDDNKTSASNIVETRVPYTGVANLMSSDADVEASDLIESKVPIIDAGDLDTDASENLESFVDISGMPVDLTVSASDQGLSKTG